MKSTIAKVTAVTGKAYGAAFLLLGSRSLGADLVVAVEGAEMGAMTPDRAVAFVWNDKITAEKSRADVEAEWIEKYASADAAAAKGDIDDIVPAEELRARICSALYMLASKTDLAPAKKHLSMPL
jgi:acetyl-CoA carboxylase carboxyltransferase component